jgi:formylmethanofuran dehydrogenase subunit E
LCIGTDERDARDESFERVAQADDVVGAVRRCARCGDRFMPTVVRRVLCAPCFGDDDRGDDE